MFLPQSLCLSGEWCLARSLLMKTLWPEVVTFHPCAIYVLIMLNLLITFSFHALMFWHCGPGWLASVLNMQFSFTCLEDVWKICDLSWSPQCKVVVLSALVNLFNFIWYVRYQARFNNKIINWKSAISMIIASSSLAGNATWKASSNSMRDFSITKHFNVSIHHPRAPNIKEVIWSPPLYSWVKCNIDGASIGNPGNSVCGRIFRNNEADFLCCLLNLLGIQTITLLKSVVLYEL